MYNGWLEDSKNCYMGKTNEAFIQLIQQITNEELPSLTQAGYQTAKERSINKIGEELKNVYESVLNEKVSSKLKKYIRQRTSLEAKNMKIGFLPIPTFRKSAEWLHRSKH